MEQADMPAAGGNRAAAIRGCWDALRFPAWVSGVVMLGVGSLAHDLGFPFWAAVLSTPLIWAGPAQFVLFGSLASGAGLVAVAVAVSLTSMRLLPMGLSLLPLMEQPRRNLAMRLLLAHYTVVVTWTEGQRRLPALAPERRAPYYLGFANTAVLLATLLTALGFVMSAAVPPVLAAALLFLTPLFFSLSLLAGTRSTADGLAVGLGVLLMPVATPLVGPDLDLLAVGLLGGSLAYLARRAGQSRGAGR
ncbi:AzlC family ABC transporter permease [Pseudochelatococcus sp. B33]